MTEILQQFLNLLTTVPIWFIYVTYIIFNFILLKYYLKIFIRFVEKLNEQYMSESSAIDFYHFYKIIGFAAIFLSFIILFLYLYPLNTFIKKLPIIITFIIMIGYNLSSQKLLNHIIVLKYNVTIIKDRVDTYLCGEIVELHDGYYLDYAFRDEKIKII